MLVNMIIIKISTELRAKKTQRWVKPSDTLLMSRSTTRKPVGNVQVTDSMGIGYAI